MKALGHRKAGAPSPSIFYRNDGSPLPSSFDLRAVMPMADVRDQQASSSCVGESAAAACHIAAGCRGAYPSPLAAYTMARAKERARIGIPLTDAGCDPFDAVAALLQWGIVSESDWPLDMSQVDAELPWDVLQDAQRLAPGDLQLIVTSGNDRINDVRSSIVAHAAVTFAMPVDAAFEGWSSDVPYAGLTGAVLGGHALCAVGYREDAILIRNSWGTGWGNAGYVWIANGFFAGPQVTDLVSVSGAPVLGGE